jgi:large subunit ribosomal protein L23
MQVLLAPVISEKATLVADKNEQVVFEVAADATKQEVKAAVELLFKVEVSRSTCWSEGQAKALRPFDGPSQGREEGVRLPEARPGNQL